MNKKTHQSSVTEFNPKSFPPNSKRLLSVGDIEREYGVNPSFLYYLKRYRKLRYIQIGKKILFKENDWIAFVESHCVDGESQQ